MDEVEKVMAKAAGLQQVRDLIAIEECVREIMKNDPNSPYSPSYGNQVARLSALYAVEKTLANALSLETP